MKKEMDPFKLAVLDGRQLALKVSANRCGICQFFIYTFLKPMQPAAHALKGDADTAIAFLERAAAAKRAFTLERARIEPEFAALTDGSAARLSIATADALTRSLAEDRKVRVAEILESAHVSA